MAEIECGSAAYFWMRTDCWSGVTESLNLSRRMCLTEPAMAIDDYVISCPVAQT
jgi:hypothetical protein